jgi:hypothetical protein
MQASEGDICQSKVFEKAIRSIDRRSFLGWRSFVLRNRVFESEEHAAGFQKGKGEGFEAIVLQS